MDIKSSDYQIYYETLCYRMDVNRFKAKVGEKKKTYGRLFWDKVLKYGYFDALWNTGSKSHYYFYNKYTKFKRNDEIKLENNVDTFDDEIFVSTRKYIPFSTDVQKELAKKQTIGKKAEYLRDEFAKLYKDEIDKRRLEIKEKLEAVRNKTGEVDHQASRTPAQHFIDVTLMLKRYFKHIDDGNFGHALNIWSSKAREKLWNNDIRKFAYRQLPRINVLSVTNHQFLKYDRVRCEIELQVDLEPDETGISIFGKVRFKEFVSLLEWLRRAESRDDNYNIPIHTMLAPRPLIPSLSEQEEKFCEIGNKSIIRYECFCTHEKEWVISHLGKAPQIQAELFR